MKWRSDPNGNFIRWKWVLKHSTKRKFSWVWLFSLVKKEVGRRRYFRFGTPSNLVLLSYIPYSLRSWSGLLGRGRSRQTYFQSLSPQQINLTSFSVTVFTSVKWETDPEVLLGRIATHGRHWSSSMTTPSLVQLNRKDSIGPEVNRVFSTVFTSFRGSPCLYNRSVSVFSSFFLF